MSSEPLAVGDFGDEVARLHERLKFHGVEVSPEEQKRKFFGPSTREAIGEIQKTHGIDPTCDVCSKTAAVLEMQPMAAPSSASPIASASPIREKVDGILGSATVLPSTVPVPMQPSPSSPSPSGAAHVSGIIALEHGLPATQLTVRLYQRGFGGVKTLLSEGATDAGGQYALNYASTGSMNIEVYAVGPDGKETQLSTTKFAASAQEQLDLVAPTRLQPPVSEFSRLNVAVAPHVNNQPELLKTAREGGERHDLSFLANATGWDAGAIALASEAFTGEAKTKIPAEGLYALARAGLPTDVQRLAHVPQLTVANALRQAADAGIIASDVVGTSVQAFGEFAAEFKFTTRIHGTLSSPKDFVGKARVSDSDRTAFSKVVRENASGNLWERSKAEGVSEGGIKTLQLQGKLAYLTFNNAELTDHLTTKVKTDPKELIDLGYYDESKWEETLRTLAGTDPNKLERLIPQLFTGRTSEDRIQSYSAELARRVRQMDPHAVTVDRLATNKIQGAGKMEGVGTFLKQATTAGFRLGKTPLSQFVAKQPDALWNGIVPEKRAKVLDDVRTLSSLYAISPDDESFSALLRAGYTSATDIARFDYRDLVFRLKPHLVARPKHGDRDVTTAIYWKAQQQSATVFNVFDGLKRLNTAPYAPGSTPADVKRRDDQVLVVREKLKGLFPTLESLFGSVDFCECNHCQSVLSPAAYLVDLLHFVDPNEEAWATVKGSYEARMGVPYTKRKPFDVLNERRPDIKNIALTCENTNTALPYIDVVLEVLEQLMMADSTPPGIEAYDVGDTASQDLLAEPQNILWSAYVGSSSKKGLRDLVYPLTLPFDLPLEMARAFLRQLELPLWRLRECLAQPRTLGPSANGRTDGWTDVWFERLGLGPADIETLIRSDKWFELYGYVSEEAALGTTAGSGGAQPVPTSLRNGKTLSRRLGVTYEELVELIRTRFINSGIEPLIVLKDLGIDPNTLDRYLGVGPSLPASDRNEVDARLKAKGITGAELSPLRADAIRASTVELRAPSVGCDFGKTTLAFDKDPANADQAMALVLRKLNAFVRLQKKLGWEIHELDRLLMAMMPSADSVTMASWSDAMKTTLIYLAHVEELRVQFDEHLSREEIAVFWSAIPTVGLSPLYERLFWNPGATGRHVAFKKRVGLVLQDKTVLLTAHIDVIRQAFQLSQEEIVSILVAAGAADRILSIDNLSTLMRYALLARGLGISIEDLLVFLALSERKPLSPLSTGTLTDLSHDIPWSETLAFVREVRLLAEAGVDVAFVNRLCRLQGVEDQPSPDKDPVLIALASLPPMKQGASEADQTLIARQHQALIVQTLAAQLSVPEAIVDRLLGSVLKDAANKPLKEVGFPDPIRAQVSLQKLRRAIDLIQGLRINEAELQYLMGIISALNPNDLPVDTVPNDTVAKNLRKGLTAWLELAATRSHYGPSERLLAVLTAARQPFDSVNTAAVREKQLHDTITALIGLKQPGLALALEAIGAVSGGGASFEVLSLAEPRRLQDTLDSLKCLTRIGISPKDIVQLAQRSIDVAAATRLRSSLKGRYTASAWRRIAKPIFDGLRKKQRDALVAHLTHVMDGETPKYGDTAEKLFEYLLLDPGMEPVVVGSRIQMAIASVQLFVQRCLMNLEEAGVDPQIIDSQRWEWMRRYRVWEANRKIFIWPENWLDPEFRDDKTHLFRALEGQLLEGDVNEDTVRTALYTYLKGLESIARLQILTMYFEPGVSPDGSVIHVVGRTSNAPHKYFYRQASHGMWTPWEPIDVGIEGEHLVLTSWRGRIHLFWVSFLQETGEGKKIPQTFAPATESVNTGDLRGITTVKLQLHWVEQIQGKWDNRSSTPNFVETEFQSLKATTDHDKRLFFVRAKLVENAAGIQDDNLEILITQGNLGHTFLFFSKLAPPISQTGGAGPDRPSFVVSSDPMATKWSGSEALQAQFIAEAITHSESGETFSGGGPHTILARAGTFNLVFPSNERLPVPARNPPAGVGRVAAYVFRPQNARHVTYRSGDGNIHDLFWTKNGWFYQSPSLEAENLGADDSVEPAMNDPHGYALDDRGVICIAYTGDTKVQELVWSQLDAELGDQVALGTGWRNETLYLSTSEGDRPQGRLVGGIFSPQRGVVFRTKKGQLRAAIESAGPTEWEIRDFNAALPPAASDPCGVLMTQTALGVTSVVSRHIFYLGVDNGLYELRSDGKGQVWTSENITEGIPTAVKPAPGSVPSAYAFLQDNTLHVVYRGVDNRIHELSGKPGTWKYSAIGAGFTKAIGDPSGYSTEKYAVKHVVYRGEGDEVVELWWRGAWREHVLTKSVSDAPKSKSDVTGYSFEALGTQHVAYLAEGGQLRELGWNTSGWSKGAYELRNPLADRFGHLAAPFFFQSEQTDHTFFVEPYVVETAVHEWTEWIVTTKEYESDRFNWKLVPLIPDPIVVKPNDVGTYKIKPEKFKRRAFEDSSIIRTPKGVIVSQPGVTERQLRGSLTDLTKNPQVVDIKLGHLTDVLRVGKAFGGGNE